MKTPLLLNAKESAEYSGYDTIRKFKSAVIRGKMPLAYDSKTIPHLWSKAEIESRLPGAANSNISPGLAALNKRFGIK